MNSARELGVTLFLSIEYHWVIRHISLDEY